MDNDDHGLVDWDYLSPAPDDHPPTHEKLIFLADFVMKHRHYLHSWAMALIDERPLEDTGLDVFMLKLRTMADDFFEPTIFPDAS